MEKYEDQHGYRRYRHSGYVNKTNDSERMDTKHSLQSLVKYVCKDQTNVKTQQTRLGSSMNIGETDTGITSNTSTSS